MSTETYGAASGSFGRPAPRASDRRDDSLRLLERYSRTRARVDRDALVVRFLPLARRLAHSYRVANDRDDLEQVAALGLIKALDRFDPDRGVAFTSFAVPTILGELKRHFRDVGWSVRVPRELQELALRVEQAEHDRLLARLTTRERAVLRLRFQEDLLQREIAARMGISQMQVSRLITRAIATLQQQRARPAESLGVLVPRPGARSGQAR